MTGGLYCPAALTLFPIISPNTTLDLYRRPTKSFPGHFPTTSLPCYTFHEEPRASKLTS